MDDKESLKILSEIRDEIKEMNYQIKWLKKQATEAMEHEENPMLKVAELENRKSKKDLLTIIVIAVGLGCWFMFHKLGYL